MAFYIVWGEYLVESEKEPRRADLDLLVPLACEAAGLKLIRGKTFSKFARASDGAVNVYKKHWRGENDGLLCSTNTDGARKRVVTSKAKVTCQRCLHHLGLWDPIKKERTDGIAE